MSLFNTIAHPKTAGTTVAVRGAIIVVLALGAAIALGFAVAGPGAADDANPTGNVGRRLAHEDFLRLNTTELEYLVPSLGMGVIEPERVDPFIHWNTTAFDGLVPRQHDGDRNNLSKEFLRLNIESLEYPVVAHPEQPYGPR